jgi:hypothetical protein
MPRRRHFEMQPGFSKRNCSPLRGSRLQSGQGRSSLRGGGPSDQLQRIVAGIIMLKDLSQKLGRTMSRLSAQMSFSTKYQPTAVFVVGVALWLNAAIAQAGPCTADISQFEATVHQSAGDPLAGLTARQSVNAQLGHQPTPQSVHQADQRLKSRFSAAMTRAKRYDAQGNHSGCARALDAAKKIYIP